MKQQLKTSTHSRGGRPFGQKSATAVILLAVFFAFSCQSSTPRDPDEVATTDAQYQAATITDIAVIPVQNKVPEEQLPADQAFTFPEVEARHLMRRFLIDSKDYAVPKAGWVDAQKKGGLDTDAILQFELTQWDSSQLLSRGVIYAGGNFKLRSIKKGKQVWNYECQDLQLAVSAPHGGQAADRNMREAAALLVKTALGRMPKKLTE